MSGYQRSSFPGCCGIDVIHSVTHITIPEIRSINKFADGSGDRRIAVVQLKNPEYRRTQQEAYKKFMANGWKHLGRSWVADTGNTLQMIMYTPKKRSKR